MGSGFGVQGAGFIFVVQGLFSLCRAFPFGVQGFSFRCAGLFLSVCRAFSFRCAGLFLSVCRAFPFGVQDSGFRANVLGDQNRKKKNKKKMSNEKEENG